MNSTFQNILSISFAGNTVHQYLVALGIFVAIFVTLKIFQLLVLRRFRHLFARMRLSEILYQFFTSISGWLFPLMGLYGALQILNVPPFIDRVFHFLILASGLFMGVRLVQQLIDYGASKLLTHRQKDMQPGDLAVVEIFKKIIKVSLWVVALIVILQNLGYNISALVGGLGIGGVAIALASQNVLTDIFASISIYLDKPFQVGDSIMVGNDRGEVKKIGIKTTRLQTPHGEELIISNRELTTVRVNNFRGMDWRRVPVLLGVSHDTPAATLQIVPGMVKQVFEKMNEVDLEHVYFKELDRDLALFEVVYLVRTNDYKKYIELQQQINLAVKRSFEEQKINLISFKRKEV